MYRSITAMAVVLKFVLLVSSATGAADVQIKEGMVVSASANMLVIVDSETKQHSYEVGSTIPVRINGKNGKLEDLKKSTPVKVTIDKQGKVMSVATIDTHKAPAE